MNKSSNVTRIITEVGLFAAVGYVLDELQGLLFGAVFTAGGSIGFAMLAVLLIAYRRGWLPAICTGLIMGLLDMSTKFYYITFWQVLLDYILPYALVGAAGFFKPWYDSRKDDKSKILILILGAVAGGLLKFLSHFIVGLVIWAPMGYDWPIPNMAVYSFAYNMAFTGPSIVLCAAMLVILYKRVPNMLSVKSEVEPQRSEHIKWFDYGITPTILVSGLFLFIYFLIAHITSFKIADKGYAIKISFAGDANMLIITGLIMTFNSIVLFIRTLLHKQNYRLMTFSLLVLSFANIVYSLVRLIICYTDDPSDPLVYYLWMFGTVILNALFILLYLKVKKIESADPIIETKE